MYVGGFTNKPKPNDRGVAGDVSLATLTRRKETPI